MTVCLTVGATILHLTAVLVPSTNFTLTLVGAQITGSATAGGRLTVIERMKATVAVIASGANIMCTIAGIRVTRKRLVGIKRTSVAMITFNRNGSLMHSLRL